MTLFLPVHEAAVERSTVFCLILFKIPFLQFIFSHFFFFLNCDQDCTISFIVLNATCFYLTHMDFLLGRILFSITKDVAERSIPSDVSQMGF